jgi:hypothetical protein
MAGKMTRPSSAPACVQASPSMLKAKLSIKFAPVIKYNAVIEYKAVLKYSTEGRKEGDLQSWKL